MNIFTMKNLQKQTSPKLEKIMVIFDNKTDRGSNSKTRLYPLQ